MNYVLKIAEMVHAMFSSDSSVIVLNCFFFQTLFTSQSELSCVFWDFQLRGMTDGSCCV